MSRLRVLALEPYYGGSHRSFLDGWSHHSRHEFDTLGLPAYKWKWRMRHSALTLSEQVNERVATGESWDILFCSDMLPLAEFCGLVSPEVARLPRIFYFHENQLTYPTRTSSERDHHFAFTNFVSAAAANRVWFNSAFHQDAFLSAMEAFLKRMPDFEPLTQLETLRTASHVHSPGIPSHPPRGERKPGPLRILWAARWEHDKGPDEFFEALSRLRESHKFELYVLGESFDDSPPIFETARERFAAEIRQWGFVKEQADFFNILRTSDVIVSTATHEFFGIAVAEAVAAGTIPVVPRRLAYPEVTSEIDHPQCIYDGSVDDLVDKLQFWCKLADSDGIEPSFTKQMQASVDRYLWPRRACEMDDAIEDSVAMFNGQP
ncbi:MAG: DUF3524 domain-containing protein [Planctomycetota bacterium]